MIAQKIIVFTQDPDLAQQLETTIRSERNYNVVSTTRAEIFGQLIEQTDFKIGIIDDALLAQLNAETVKLQIILLCPKEQTSIAMDMLSFNLKGCLTYPLEKETVMAILDQLIETTWTEEKYTAMVNELTEFNTSLENRIREVTVLQGIGRSVNMTLDLDAVLNRVVEAATFITKAEEGYLMLLEPETGELYLRAAKDMDDRRSRVMRLQINDSVAGSVVQTGQPVTLSGNADKLFKIKTGYVVHSLINVPLKIRDRVIGVLGVDNPTSEKSFSLDDLGNLMTLAESAAAAIENARIYHQTSSSLTKRIEELDILHNLAQGLNEAADQTLVAQLVLSQAIKTLKADMGILGWFGADEPLWLSHGILAEAQQSGQQPWWSQEALKKIMNQGKPYLATSTLNGNEIDAGSQANLIQSRLAVPVTHANKPLGIIALGCYSGDAFNNDHLRFLQAITHHAALALQSTSLAKTLSLLRTQLSLLMGYATDAIWTINTDFEILDINPAACYLLGWQETSVIGKNCTDIWPLTAENGHKEIGRYLEQAMALGGAVSFNQGVTLTSQNGRVTLVEGVAYPLFDQGRLIGATAIFGQASPDRNIEQVQADFISLASHNLRTPLMSIQAALDFVLEGNGDHEKNERLLAEARSQSQKIALFLRDLLDISQLTQGRELPLNIKPVNLIDLLTAIVTETQTEAIEINFELDVPDAVPLIATDKVKTTSVFHKLVAYAKGRSEPGDVLKITVEELDNDVVVSILDSGAPLSPQQHQQIFWQVYPLEANKNNGAMPYGYGLGLYSVRRLVELLGGNIWVSQPAPRGVSLNVTLPIWR